MTGSPAVSPTAQRQLDLVPDALLAGRAADGDTAAFEALARRHGPLMRATARRLTGTLADADDVVQESLMQAWKQLDQLRDPAAVKSWLLRIVGTRSIDHLRKRRNHLALDDLENHVDAPSGQRTPDPESTAVNASRVDALKSALARLPEEQRRCWVLKEFNDLSYEEIALTLNISPASVRGRLARARIALARTMEEWR
ncbi:DNA-directed RNA polymerase sigma-70 factor [Arthrobacter sp. StoSoilB3]|uniref:RNA polymerase sigma factor n=1 Tax=Paenarthrobacter nicotinovorans TaxID=29320 RepID=A0ABT9TQD6_PAENI|nr:RNA polymerase sigma factor [Paenarthrobacter nicotinovorans]BCW12579.1 DNA-directed RNA polymerase sigma-70 factor [Arthrobacter sp. NtRootA2]BCW16661.1 DNA-directed RNA polymerase sigma-70 factor [Arthrobacter sp. NtRootA4]BCW24994.1 DNA-directed RNA polymerase sigma-70 factor [Arthrobacter sp. NtRootC7]BCW29263.1 DNA-directed RNA polymerase sigma-70 factor [Arthrobacter sp. NtRootC45]BCW33534.1 DNA-directed RNA polymerase sigma-70 factor [Arthrobacter sp. NtRootD5]BCW42400.1 DNA-directe